MTRFQSKLWLVSFWNSGIRSLRWHSDLEAWRLQSHGVPLASMVYRWTLQPPTVHSKVNYPDTCHSKVDHEMCLYIDIDTDALNISIDIDIWYNNMHVLLYIYIHMCQSIGWWFCCILRIFGTATHLVGVFLWGGFRVLRDAISKGWCLVCTQSSLTRPFMRRFSCWQLHLGCFTLIFWFYFLLLCIGDVGLWATSVILYWFIALKTSVFLSEMQ